jgi:hypothetical protein
MRIRPSRCDRRGVRVAAGAAMGLPLAVVAVAALPAGAQASAGAPEPCSPERHGTYSYGNYRIEPVCATRGGHRGFHVSGWYKDKTPDDRFCVAVRITWGPEPGGSRLTPVICHADGVKPVHFDAPAPVTRISMETVPARPGRS